MNETHEFYISDSGNVDKYKMIVKDAAHPQHKMKIIDGNLIFCCSVLFSFARWFLTKVQYIIQSSTRHIFEFLLLFFLSCFFLLS
jgi:hypothetical protein